VHTVLSWFLADPRRLCVLGAWVNLGAFASALWAVGHADLPAAGFALTLFLVAGAFKAAGLQRFRRDRR
jgi:hypothetical protein